MSYDEDDYEAVSAFGLTNETAWRLRLRASGRKAHTAPITFEYCHPSLGDDGKPMSRANIIWADRDRGSEYYRTSKYAMKNGRFPHDHPCCPGESLHLGTGEMGQSDSMEAFRKRGYWASCFPEGDGITFYWWSDGGAGFDAKTAEQVMQDIRDCFGWKTRLRP